MAKDAPPPITNAADLDAAVRDDFKALLRLDREIDAAIAKYVQDMKDERKEMWSNLGAKLDLPKADIGLFYKLFKRQEDSRTFDDEADGNAVREAHRVLFSALAKGQTLDFVDVLGQLNAKPKEPATSKGVFQEPREGSSRQDQRRQGVPTEAPAGAEEPNADTTAEDEDAPVDATASSGAAPEPEGTADQDPLTSPMFVPHRGAGAAAFAAGKGEDTCPYKAGSQTFVAWMYGYYKAEGGAAYDKDEAITSCRYSTGSPAWRHWNAGWNDAARKDGRDAEAVGAAAVKGAAGADVPEATAGRRKRATTSQIGTA
jgi:hypothetical protein